MTAITVLVVDDHRGFRDCACRLTSSHDRADLDRLVPSSAAQGFLPSDELSKEAIEELL
jgi:acetolactate synthase regulatory subunit